MYALLIKRRRMRWAGHVARMGEKRNAYRIIGGKARRIETTRKTRRRWVVILIWILERMRWYGLD
jgi:hypothetical protein